MTEHHIYMLPSSGRINLGALTSDKIEYVAQCIAKVVNN
jgi:aspartate/tyrosine/aromatic aminotransferase